MDAHRYMEMHQYYFKTSSRTLGGEYTLKPEGF